MIVKAQFRNRKKFIKISEACFDLFLAEVKEKFSIPDDLAVTVTDETGTEVDKDVFPDLMSTSGLVLVINELTDMGSSTPQSSVSLDTDTLSLTSKSSEESDWFSPKQFRKDEDDDVASQRAQARDLIKQILETRPGGGNVLEYEDTGTISDDTRKVMVNILVAHMMETEGRVPHRLTKQKYGLGIITLFPSLRDPQGRTGYEHFYDGQKNTGFLSWRLKTVQRGTRPSGNKEDPKTEEKGGPLLDRQLCYQEHQLDNDQSVEAISLMNHTSEREVIMQKMKATFEYRQRLVHDPEGSTTILSVFPRFLDTKGLILQDFSLLFGSETASRLLERWPTVFKAKVIRLGETLTPTPLLKRLLSSAKQSKESSEAQDSPEWDSDISSFLLLLHLLSPQASGRKKIQRISISQAIDHLVVFHKAYRNTLSWKRIVSHTFLPQGAARKPSVTTSLWWIKSSSPVKNPLHWLPLMNSSRFILFSVSVMIAIAYHWESCTIRGIESGPVSNELLSDLENSDFISEQLQIDISSEVMVTPWVKCQGTEYRSDLVVFLEFVDDAPVFGKIVKIFIKDGIYFLVSCMESEFIEHLHGFSVVEQEHCLVLKKPEELMYYKPFDLQMSYGNDHLFYIVVNCYL